MSWFDDSQAKSAVDVATLFDSGVPVAMARVIQAGALVSVGRTSDGGAVGFTVTLDGRWRREYFRESEDAVDWLLQAAEAVETEAARSDAPTGRGRGQRSTRGR